MGSAMVALLSFSVYSRPNHHRFDGIRVFSNWNLHFLFNNSVLKKNSCLHYLLPRPRGEEVEKLRRPLPFVPQTARTTRFQQSYMIYALNNYQIVRCIVVLFLLICVSCWSFLRAAIYTINVCVCMLFISDNCKLHIGLGHASPYCRTYLSICPSICPSVCLSVRNSYTALRVASHVDYRLVRIKFTYHQETRPIWKYPFFQCTF